ncbi:hypothetical protein BC835DRAFT_1529070 [Cytidiella melzeri]|nr:hypothetical protein BC835DRAFT_1529070 [Cytidiella melzeri]
MLDGILYASLCVFFVALVFARRDVALRHVAISRTVDVTELRGVRTLLAPTDVPILVQLQSRATPNLRLVRAFGLTNTFVSSDMDVHAQFGTAARKMLAAATPKGDWLGFATATTEIVDETLASVPLGFDLFVQHVVLKVVLHTLFQVPTGQLDERGIELVARGINKLWKLSKTREDLPSDLLPGMNAHLHAWLPDFANPLDFVIPTFETMWRVVAITVALVHKDEHALHALRSFLQNPTKAQFKHFYPDTPSVSAIVAEVMRLYPPTRTISRALVSSPSTLGAWLHSIVPSMFPPTVHVANIRAVQRDPAIWGPEADHFKPMRHHPRTLTNEQSMAMLGFGAGKLQCVANSWAPLASGLLAAAILAKVGDGLEIIEGEGIGGRDGWDGWAVVVPPST